MTGDVERGSHLDVQQGGKENYIKLHRQKIPSALELAGRLPKPFSSQLARRRVPYSFTFLFRIFIFFPSSSFFLPFQKFLSLDSS